MSSASTYYYMFGLAVILCYDRCQYVRLTADMLRCLLHSPVNSTVLCPNIFHSNLFSNILRQCLLLVHTIICLDLPSSCVRTDVNMSFFFNAWLTVHHLQILCFFSNLIHFYFSFHIYNFLLTIFSTCFGPAGPSSGE